MSDSESVAALAAGLVRAQFRPPDLPRLPEPPAEVPPGWYVTQWRRIRGLEP